MLFLAISFAISDAANAKVDRNAEKILPQGETDRDTHKIPEPEHFDNECLI